MSAVNGSIVLLIIAIVCFALLAALHHLAKEFAMNTTDYPAVNDPDYEELMYRAEGYGHYYATHHPGLDAPLSYEYADMLTISDMLAQLGADSATVDPDDQDMICQSFEDAYAETDNDKTGWKFPPCTCPHWDPLNRVQVAKDAGCPAHDGDAWNDLVNNRKK